MKQGTIIIIAVVLVTVGFLGYAIAHKQTAPGPLDSFAQCLGERGAKFYGAFWCPHCQAQKALFGSSVKKLPYVECSLPDGKTRTPICIAEDIQSYPTWVYADGSTTTGERTLQELADKTTCALPK